MRLSRRKLLGLLSAGLVAGVAALKPKQKDDLKWLEYEDSYGSYGELIDDFGRPIITGEQDQEGEDEEEWESWWDTKYGWIRTPKELVSVVPSNTVEGDVVIAIMVDDKPYDQTLSYSPAAGWWVHPSPPVSPAIAPMVEEAKRARELDARTSS